MSAPYIEFLKSKVKLAEQAGFGTVPYRTILKGRKGLGIELAPPDARAWGRVALLAKGKGICDVKETARSRLKHAHCRHINVWQSNVYRSNAGAVA